MTSNHVCLLNELPAANSVAFSLQLESLQLIIPRQYLFYLYLNLNTIPHALRSDFIQQRLQQASPFAQVATWVVQEGDTAQIWFWDQALVDSRRSQSSEAPSAVLPESALHQPLTQGFRLQPCITGWELQYWEAASLRNTRWLAQKPEQSRCADFVRACGYTLDQAEWVDGEAALLARPWNEKPFWSKETLLSEKIATRILAGILLVWVTLELGMGLGTQIKESYLASSVATQNTAMMDLVDQRDNALRQKEFNQAINRLTNAPTPLFLAAQVHECLADFDFAILDWQYQRGQLMLLLQQEKLDTRALIESCAANPAFGDVRVEPGITPAQTRVLFNLPGALINEGGPDA